MTTGCVFCQILAGKVPASVVLENDLVIAFLDIRPANPGHTLVVPRRHVHSFTDLTSTEVAQVALCGQRVAAALKRGAVPCEGITVSLADGAAAGQDVPHTHLHIIPRRATDGFGWRAAGRLEQRGELDAIARQIRRTLEDENDRLTSSCSGPS
jgi:histidine triad (HIT) family protein